MSSWLDQVTVVPTATVSVPGPKLKLSIFTSAVAAACGALAETLGHPVHTTDAARINTATLQVYRKAVKRIQQAGPVQVSLRPKHISFKIPHGIRQRGEDVRRTPERIQCMVISDDRNTDIGGGPRNRHCA